MDRDHIQNKINLELQSRASVYLDQLTGSEQKTQPSVEPEVQPDSSDSPKTENTAISGHQSRMNRGARQLALECPNTLVRKRIGDFYRLYGEHRGLSQSPFLVNFLLDAMTAYDLKHGGDWMKSAADGPSQS